VAINSQSKRDGKALEILGSYNPYQNPAKASIKKDRYNYWLSVGAQPSEAVAQLVAGKYTFKPYIREEREEASDSEKND